MPLFTSLTLPGCPHTTVADLISYRIVDGSGDGVIRTGVISTKVSENESNYLRMTAVLKLLIPFPRLFELLNFEDLYPIPNTSL